MTCSEQKPMNNGKYIEGDKHKEEKGELSINKEKNYYYIWIRIQ